MEIDREFIERLKANPANIARQLAALTEISDWSRNMHRDNFDGYLIAASELLARPTADLGEAVARIEAAVDECSSDKASECLDADSFFQDAQTGRAIYVRDIRALLGHLIHRKADLGEDGELLLRELRDLAVALHRQHYAEVTHWQPLDDARGILSQIDNMTAGMRDRIELYREAVKHAHSTLVELKIARTLSEGGVGGAATAVSGVVNKLRAVLRSGG